MGKMTVRLAAVLACVGILSAVALAAAPSPNPAAAASNRKAAELRKQEADRLEAQYAAEPFAKLKEAAGAYVKARRAEAAALEKLAAAQQVGVAENVKAANDDYGRAYEASRRANEELSARGQEKSFTLVPETVENWKKTTLPEARDKLDALIPAYSAAQLAWANVAEMITPDVPWDTIEEAKDTATTAANDARLAGTVHNMAADVARRRALAQKAQSGDVDKKLSELEGANKQILEVQKQDYEAQVALRKLNRKRSAAMTKFDEAQRAAAAAPRAK